MTPLFTLAPLLTLAAFMATVAEGAGVSVSPPRFAADTPTVRLTWTR